MSSNSLTRPWWRRPSPYWLMPYGFAVVLTFGMTTAPRPELLVDLACIAHAPAVPAADSVEMVYGTPYLLEQQSGPLAPLYATRAESLSMALSSNYTMASNTTVPSPFPDLGTARCRRDVGVQRFAARIQMGFTLIGGLMAVLTTGFWGSLSDRVGRRRVMAIGQSGLLLYEAAFLFIVTHPGVITSVGVWTLFVGPMLQGICGGLSTYNTAMTAYLADVAGNRSISAYLSLIMGVLRVGAMAGPIAGTFLIKRTNDTLMPFKVAVCVHCILIAALLTFIPESLSRQERDSLARKAAAEREAARETSSDTSTLDKWTRRALAPFEPLRIFLPSPNGSRAMARGHYNLLILAAVEFVIALTKGIGDSKTQYAILVYGWTQAQFGPFFSFIDACKVVILTCFMPLLTKYVQPLFSRAAQKGPPHSNNVGDATAPTEHTPLIATCNDEAATSDVEQTPTEATKKRGSMRFDYYLLLACFVIEISAYFALGAGADRSATLYVVASAWAMVASPLDSCFASLALSLAPPDVQPGRLFGAFGVVDALSLYFLSAPLYAGVFSATIGWYPAAIFLVATASMVVAFLLCTAVRMPTYKDTVAREEADE